VPHIGLNPGFLAAQIPFLLCTCALPIFSLMILAWVYRDARSRGENGALWIIILLIGNILGLILWFVVRPPRIQYTQDNYQNSGYDQGVDTQDNYLP
jgi:hypothetical protein